MRPPSMSFLARSSAALPGFIEPRRIAGLHRAAVLDADGLGSLGADELRERRADESVDFLRLVGRSRAASADRPDGLVRDDKLRAVGGRDVLEADVHLADDDFLELAGVSLLKRLADAYDGRETGGNRGPGTQIDRLVRLAEILTALAVADDDILRARVEKHSGRDLARVGAGLLPVAVLRADADMSASGSRDCGRHVNRGRAAHDLDVREILRCLDDATA